MRRKIKRLQRVSQPFYKLKTQTQTSLCEVFTDRVDVHYTSLTLQEYGLCLAY